MPDVLDLVKHAACGPAACAGRDRTGPHHLAIDQAFGVQFSTENGTFWGTPTELWPARTYTVRANNSGGSATATVTISPSIGANAVLHAGAPDPRGDGEQQRRAAGRDPRCPRHHPHPRGLPWACSSAPRTDPGGMAEEVWSNRTYTVWANNSGGSTSVTFSLEVISQTPRLLYAENLVLGATCDAGSLRAVRQRGHVGD